jgi:hypothetical protein
MDWTVSCVVLFCSIVQFPYVATKVTVTPKTVPAGYPFADPKVITFADNAAINNCDVYGDYTSFTVEDAAFPGLDLGNLSANAYCRQDWSLADLEAYVRTAASPCNPEDVRFILCAHNADSFVP